MREILFRGKRLDDGKWVYGAYSQYNFSGEKDTGIIEIPCIIDYDDDCLWCEIVPESIGQYTGLTDKNGKRIFEGDIVSTDITRPYLIVEFRDGCFMMNCNDGGEDYTIKDAPFEWEIIGNIHDNPELLEAK